MRTKKFIILVILFILITSAAAGTYYLNKVVLPTVVKDKITTGLDELTGLKVTLKSLNFNLLRGVVISGLAFHDKDNPKNIICSIKDSSAGFLLINFIKEKKIIIPLLSINSIEFSLIREKDGSFNIAALIERLQKQATPGKAPMIFIKAIKISNSTIHFNDLASEKQVAMDLDIDQMSMNMYWQKATALAKAAVTKDKKRTDFKIKANYSYSNENFDAEISADAIDTSIFHEYLKNIPIIIDNSQFTDLKINFLLQKSALKCAGMFNFNSLSIKKDNYFIKDASGSANLALETDIGDLKNTTSQGIITFEDASLSYSDAFNVSGKMEKSSLLYAMDMDNLKLSLDLSISGINAAKDNINLSGGVLQTNTKINLPLAKEKDAAFQIAYEGSADISAEKISWLETIDSTTNANAKIDFKNNEVLIKKLRAKALESDISGTGSLKGNMLELNIEGDFDIEKIAGILQENIDLPAYDISGTTEAKITIISELTKPEQTVFKGEATVQNISLELPENKISLEADTGSLKFNTLEERLEWHFEDVAYLDKLYSIDGNLNNFKIPKITTMVIGEGIKLQLELVMQKKLLAINIARGSYKNSQFNISGALKDGINISLSGDVNLELKDLKYFLPEDFDKQTFEKMNLTGKCVFNTNVTGPINDFRLWDIDTEGKSAQISCYGLKIQNIEFTYKQARQQGLVNLLSFDAYSGKGSVNGKLEFLNNDIRYSLRGDLNDVDLSELKKDTPLKDKNYYGLLNLKISIKGLGSDLNTLSGSGAFLIKNGNIWEFNPLQGLGNFIFSPGFNTMTFTDAQADFLIQNSSVFTDNLELLGPKLGLMCEGSVGFDGTLDLIVNTQLPFSGSEKKIEDISRAGSLTAIKITGSTKEPKYKLQAIGENIMKKVGEIFSNILP